MDISQIPIKINQNNNTANGKQPTVSQNGGSPGFLSQILAIVNQLNPGNTDESNPSGQNSSKGLSADHKQASGDDIIMQLSSILAMLGAGGMNNANPVQELSLQTNPASGAEPEMEKIRADISGLVQKLTAAGIGPSQGENPPAVSLKQLISDLQSGIENNKELPNDILGKIKEVLGELKIPNTLPLKEAQTVPVENSDTLPVPLPGIILDKNLLAIAGRAALPDVVQADLSKNQKQLVVAGGAIPLPAAQANQTQHGTAGRAEPLDGGQAYPPINKTQLAVAGGAPIPDLAQVNPLKIKKQTGVETSLFAADRPLQTAEGNTAPKAELPPVIPVSDFNREISDWIGRFINITKDQTGSTEAKFSLFPENLGPVEIKVVSQNGEISAQIAIGTSQAKEALEGQLPQLHQALLDHGLQVQKLDIVQQVSPATNQSNLSFSQSGYQPPQEQKQYQQARAGAGSGKNERANEGRVEADAPLSTYAGGNQSYTSSIDFTA